MPSGSPVLQRQLCRSSERCIISGVPRTDEQQALAAPRDGAIWRDSGGNPDGIATGSRATAGARLGHRRCGSGAGKLDPPPAPSSMPRRPRARHGLVAARTPPRAQPSHRDMSSTRPRRCRSAPTCAEPAQCRPERHRTGAAISLDIPLRVTIEIAPPTVPPPCDSPTARCHLQPERITPAAMAYDRAALISLACACPRPGIKPKPGGGLLAVTQPSHPRTATSRIRTMAVLMCARRRMVYLFRRNVDFMAPHRHAQRTAALALCAHPQRSAAKAGYCCATTTS